MRGQMFINRWKTKPMQAARFGRVTRRHAWTFFTALLIGAPAAAQDARLWRYPCDYSFRSACIRLPDFMIVSYEVPADFGLHTVTSKAGMSMIIYEGDAHSLDGSITNPSISFSDRGRTVSGYLSSPSAGKKVLDVVVLRGNSRNGAIHIHADVADERKRVDAANVLSGFRVCEFRNSRRLNTGVCPRESSIGERLAEWLKGHDGGG
ncbi:hypothetical protein QE373_001191 [Stenotrophomonas sp. SORGH_AS321]|nr:hypothetical protein [Stenotrophomonas sp. SORGH_AS_0321]